MTPSEHRGGDTSVEARGSLGAHAACAWCGNPGFRRSRLRSKDLPKLLVLKVPVRCTRCAHRQFVGLLAAMSVVSARPQDDRAPEAQEGSATWNERLRPADPSPHRSGPAERAAVPVPNPEQSPAQKVAAAGSQPAVLSPAHPPAVTTSRRRDPHGIW